MAHEAQHPTRAHHPTGSWVRAVGAVVARPHLWWTAVKMLRRFGRPSREYLGFRMLTAYGDPAAAPVAGDVVAYLEWLRAWDDVVGRHGS